MTYDILALNERRETRFADEDYQALSHDPELLTDEEKESHKLLSEHIARICNRPDMAAGLTPRERAAREFLLRDLAVPEEFMPPQFTVEYLRRQRQKAAEAAGAAEAAKGVRNVG